MASSTRVGRPIAATATSDRCCAHDGTRPANTVARAGSEIDGPSTESRCGRRSFDGYVGSRHHIDAVWRCAGCLGRGCMPVWTEACTTPGRTRVHHDVESHRRGHAAALRDERPDRRHDRGGPGAGPAPDPRGQSPCPWHQAGKCRRALTGLAARLAIRCVFDAGVFARRGVELQLGVAPALPPDVISPCVHPAARDRTVGPQGGGGGCGSSWTGGRGLVGRRGGPGEGGTGQIHIGVCEGANREAHTPRHGHLARSLPLSAAVAARAWLKRAAQGEPDGMERTECRRRCSACRWPPSGSSARRSDASTRWPSRCGRAGGTKRGCWSPSSPIRPASRRHRWIAGPATSTTGRSATT